MKRKLLHRLFWWKQRKDRKPLILKGTRQVGKTHLLKEFGRMHFRQTHYFNFEKQPELAKLFEKDLVPERILDALRFAQNRSINVHEDLIIFDEIQECSKALTSLKYFYEDRPDVCLCAASSFLDIHRHTGSFPVGRVMFETLKPLSFEEFLMATDDKVLSSFQNLTPQHRISSHVHEHLLTQLKHYLITGGLPEAVATYLEHKDNLFEAFSRVRKKQEDLLHAYSTDILQFSGHVNPTHIDRVLRSIPEQLKQGHNAERFRFRGVVPGISHYSRLFDAIEWLKAVGLVINVDIVETGLWPLNAYTKMNLFKLMLFDVGMLGLMCDLSPQMILDGEYGDYFVENLVAQEMLCGKRERLFSWQEDGCELDFVTDVDGKSVPVEVKSGSNAKAKSRKLFAKKYKSPQEIVFSEETLDAEHVKGLQKYPLYLAGLFCGDIKF